MATRDWALVVFTLLTQAAVGAFLTLQVLQFLAARGGAGDGDPGKPNRAAAGSGVTLEAHAVVLAVLSVGLLAALLHLSTPLQAARAVVNFSSSWLSREIVFGSLFAALLAVLVAVERRPRAVAGTRGWLSWGAAAAGVAFLYCQTAIYLLPAQPAWNSLATPVAFGGSALSLGILGVAVGFVAADRRTLRGLALAAIVVLALELVMLPLHLLSLAGDGSPAAAASAARLTGDYGGVLLLRLGLLCVAAATLGGVFLSSRRPSGHRLAATLTGAAFCIVLVSELCGRFLFYAMQVRVGI